MVSFGSSKSKSKSTPVDMTADAFKSIAPSTASRLLSIYDPPGLSGVPDYTGRLYAPITAREESVLGDVVNAGTQNPFLAASDRLLGDTISGRYVNPDTNPFLAAYIRSSQRPLVEQFEEATLGDRATFANAGHNLNESSPYARARAIADRGLASSLGDVAARIGTAAYERERAIQAQAPSQASELQSAELRRRIDTLSAAGLPRLIEEQGIERGLEVYKQRLAALQNVLGLAVSAERPAIGQESTSKANAWNFGLAPFRPSNTGDQTTQAG